MEHETFLQLSIVMVIAAVISLIARLTRQPMVIAYIVTGLLAGPSFLDIIEEHGTFESFSQIGITLLLFIIGLGLNIGIIKSTGKPIALAFTTIVLGIGFLGVLLGFIFGFTTTESLIMALALLFSSTIIVVKFLSDKKSEARLYGRIAIGVLLVEDIVATLALLLVSASAGNSGGFNDVLALLGKGLGLVTVLILVGGFIMPRLSKLFASSQELLYVFAIAWAFGVAAAFQKAGFSLEVGALFAGVALASLPYVQAIATKLKPLRDFFLVLFFVTLGLSLHIDKLANALVPALAFSLLILVTKPLLFMSSLGWLGYTKQTSFKAGVHLSQISEFSVILVVLAYTSGLVSEYIVSIVTLVTLFTIAVSAYLIQYDDQIYNKIERYLSVFERGKTRSELKSLSHYPLVLIGYREGGYTYVQTFRSMKKRYVVIDYDPDVIEHLQHQHINHLYGDVTDTELLDEIGLHRSELIISTLDSAAINLDLAKHITAANDSAIFVCHARTLSEAESLYKAGAAYVMMPHYIGNDHINQFLQKHGNNKSAFLTYRKKHLVTLGSIAVKS